LDEPTNGLDPVGMIEIRRLIMRLAALGKTIFLSSHMLHEVQQVCNRVAILQKGNLVQQGNVNELLRESEQVDVRMENEDEMQQALSLLQETRDRGASWITAINIAENKRGQAILVIKAPQSHSSEINATLARNNLFAAEIHPREGSLEALFLKVTTPSPANLHPGMEALADVPPPDNIPEASRGGKRGEQ
jgi:ABC-2 type transport system ATP-binding protein